MIQKMSFKGTSVIKQKSVLMGFFFAKAVCPVDVQTCTMHHALLEHNRNSTTKQFYRNYAQMGIPKVRDYLNICYYHQDLCLS